MTLTFLTFPEGRTRWDLRFLTVNEGGIIVVRIRVAYRYNGEAVRAVNSSDGIIFPNQCKISWTVILFWVEFLSYRNRCQRRTPDSPAFGSLMIAFSFAIFCVPMACTMNFDGDRVPQESPPQPSATANIREVENRHFSGISLKGEYNMARMTMITAARRRRTGPELT